MIHRRSSAGLAASAIFLAAAPALAFQPNDTGHLGITSEGLSPIERTINGTTYRFSEDAIYEVRDANRDTDIFEFHREEAHFDNESLDAASARVIALKEEAIQELLESPPDGETAQDRLGAALHTIQDFYSHSNWVEMGMTSPELRLGREMLSPLALGVAVCPSSPDTLEGAGLSDTTTGYYYLPNPCEAPPPGKCLHGVEGFCAGINKDAPGRGAYPQAYALAVAATRDFAEQILDDPRIAGNEAAIASLMGASSAGGDSLADALILALSGGVDAGDPRQFTFPVDSTIEELTVLVTSLDALRAPNGAAISAASSGTTIHADASGTRVTISAPQPGLWTLEVGGAGLYEVRVTGKTPLALQRFDFVTYGGSLGHEGLFSIGTTLAKHSTQLAFARLTGAPASIAFSLADEKGKRINSARLSLDPRAGSGELLGNIRIPNKPFRAMITGRDAQGFELQRMGELLYTPGK